MSNRCRHLAVENTAAGRRNDGGNLGRSRHRVNGLGSACGRFPSPASKAESGCRRVRSAAALGGLDVIVFTGGVGENAAPVRAEVCRRAGGLGIELDPVANAAGGPRITRPGGPAQAWVVAANEELVIARHARDVLGL